MSSVLPLNITSFDNQDDIKTMNELKCNKLSLHRSNSLDIGLMKEAKSLTLSPRPSSINPSNLCAPSNLSLQRSTAVTKGFFITNIMKKIEKGNSLNLHKLKVEKQNVGRGGAAFVHLARYNHLAIALKEYKFKPQDFNDDTLSKFENELNILKSLKHSNIIRFLGYHLNIRHKELKFAFEYSYFGNLFHLIHPLPTLKVVDYGYNDILRILFDIAQGMTYLHQKRIIHRDLNPRNVLLFDGVTKITDFGESMMIAESQDLEAPELSAKDKQKIGTAGYKAPEVMIQRGYNYKIDVWSFGTLCYEILTKEFASSKLDLMHYETIEKHEHCLLIPDQCPPKYGQIIFECWQFDSNKRSNFDKIVKDLKVMLDAQNIK